MADFEHASPEWIANFERGDVERTAIDMNVRARDMYLRAYTLYQLNLQEHPDNPNVPKPAIPRLVKAVEVSGLESEFFKRWALYVTNEPVTTEPAPLQSQGPSKVGNRIEGTPYYQCLDNLNFGTIVFKDGHRLEKQNVWMYSYYVIVG